MGSESKYILLSGKQDFSLTYVYVYLKTRPSRDLWFPFISSPLGYWIALTAYDDNVVS